MVVVSFSSGMQRVGLILPVAKVISEVYPAIATRNVAKKSATRSTPIMSMLNRVVMKVIFAVMI